MQRMLRTLLLLAAVAVLAAGCDRDSDEPSDDERQRAIDAALEVYASEAAAGADFSAGPCIADELEDVPGWSADIAHDPRQEIDNQAENQCAAYRDGQTEHFVELTPEGDLIRAE